MPAQIGSQKRMGPIGAEHPLVTGGEECPGCKAAFAASDDVTLVSVGPGGDPEERRRAREGRAHNSVAVPVHWACATGDESEE